MKVRARIFAVLMFALLCAVPSVWAMAAVPVAPAEARPTEFPSGPLATPLTDANIDDSASTDWFDGVGHPLATPTALRNLLWTKNTAIHYGVLRFGVSKPKLGMATAAWLIGVALTSVEFALSLVPSRSETT